MFSEASSEIILVEVAAKKPFLKQENGESEVCQINWTENKW